MKRIAFFSFIIFVLFQGQVLGSENLASIISGIQKQYGGLPGLTVKYSREVITRSMAMLGDRVKGDLAAGVIYFKPPRHLKLQQETPKPETVLVDGDIIWWYVPEKKTAYRYPAQEFGKELELLSDIFSGLLKVEEKFRVKMLDENRPNEHLVLLYPEPPWQEVDRIELRVTTAYEIVGVHIYNLMGGITRFSLLKTEQTKNFKDGVFRFKVPEGVQVKEGADQ
ncbi:outer membrane lipoprotein carrier protein LolA [Thermodesulfobacteriota bacterium]